MSEYVSATPPRGAVLAAALLNGTLDEMPLRAIEQTIQELRDDTGEVAEPLRQTTVVRKLVDHGRFLMNREAPRALLITHLTMLLAPRVKCDGPAEEARMHLLDADAHRWYATALLYLGRCFEAQEAALETRELYRDPVVRELVIDEEAQLDLTWGQILFHLGETERALQLLAQAGNVFLILGNRKRCAVARITKGGMLWHQARWDEALKEFGEANQIGNGFLEPEAIAANAHNVAYCAFMSGRPDVEETLQAAMAMLEDLKMDTEIPKIHGTKAMVLIGKGRVDEGLSEWRTMYAKYVALKMEIVAAQATPQIVEELMKAGRTSEAIEVASKAIETLSAAGMKSDVVKLQALLTKAQPS
jgi:tetratricopeptide (TPR) repeat protein